MTVSPSFRPTGRSTDTSLIWSRWKHSTMRSRRTDPCISKETPFVRISLRTTTSTIESLDIWRDGEPNKRLCRDVDLDLAPLVQLQHRLPEINNPHDPPTTIRQRLYSYLTKPGKPVFLSKMPENCEACKLGDTTHIHWGCPYCFCFFRDPEELREHLDEHTVSDFELFICSTSLTWMQMQVLAEAQMNFRQKCAGRGNTVEPGGDGGIVTDPNKTSEPNRLFTCPWPECFHPTVYSRKDGLQRHFNSRMSIICTSNQAEY